MLRQFVGMLLAPLRGKGPAGLASPLPDLADVRARAETIFRKDLDVSASIDLRREAQLNLLAALVPFYRDFDWPERPAAGRRYHLDNPYFRHSDALVLYAMLRHLAPARVIEVGSGFSSALMLDTADRFLASKTSFIFVEPYPDRMLSLLRGTDEGRYRLIRSQVQDVPPATFQTLESGDVLFVDSSHVSKVGSDVNFLLFDVLPALAPGVVVHFHDIFWPFEYPQEWVLKGSACNEGYLLRAFLQYNTAFEIMLFNSYLGYSCPEFLREHVPLFLKDTGGSLWLRKR
jgi:hypothetical protein